MIVSQVLTTSPFPIRIFRRRKNESHDWGTPAKAASPISTGGKLDTCR
jgi:hypothetical protein